MKAEKKPHRENPRRGDIAFVNAYQGKPSRIVGTFRVNRAEESISELVNKTLAHLRQDLRDAMAIIDKSAAIMARMPRAVIADCSVVCGQLLVYHTTRETALETVLALGGKWNKRICPGNTERIDYRQVIDGVQVEIYATPPPPSCRIVETEIDVPAHKKIERKIVCKEATE